MTAPTPKRWMAMAMLSGLSLMLAACILMPGKFGSAMDVRKDGRFSFQYSGEIVLLPLADKKPEAANAEFVPSPCYEDDSGNERACTKDEVAEQKAQSERERESKAKNDSEMAKMFLGGIDPSDKKSAEELANRLRRQAGWRKVIYKGDGVYEVDVLIAGRLDHDFVFPTIEGFPMANAFVQASLRNDGTLRIEAPGYGPSAAGIPMGGMMQAAAMGGDGKTPKLPEIDGTFTLRTDAQILANNTDEGPTADPAGQALNWIINSRTPSPPTVLLRLR